MKRSTKRACEFVLSFELSRPEYAQDGRATLDSSGILVNWTTLRAEHAQDGRATLDSSGILVNWTTLRAEHAQDGRATLLISPGGTPILGVFRVETQGVMLSHVPPLGGTPILGV